MTTYNGEKYLKEQLDSILSQTYTDFELVICDDCSKDKTREILNEYSKKDNRIKIYLTEENLGFKKNFEKAITFCNGEYIAFCDQDDIWNSNKLELSLANIGENSLLCTNAELTDSNLNPLGYTMKESSQTPDLSKDKLEILKTLIHHNFVQGTTILAKSDFIKKYLPIPKEVIFHDWYYAVCAILENGIKYLDECTIKYRQHLSNVTENEKASVLNNIKPKKYDKTTVTKDSNQHIYFINLVKQNISTKNLQNSSKYFEDSEKFYKCLPQKKIYTLAYLNKYFNYVYGKTNFISKRIILFKRFLGIIRYKLFTKK